MLLLNAMALAGQIIIPAGVPAVMDTPFGELNGVYARNVCRFPDVFVGSIVTVRSYRSEGPQRGRLSDVTFEVEHAYRGETGLVGLVVEGEMRGERLHGGSSLSDLLPLPVIGKRYLIASGQGSHYPLVGAAVSRAQPALLPSVPEYEAWCKRHFPPED